jgi:hypothetical protein
MNDLLTKKQRLYEELTQLAGYELLPYGKMIRARERVRQIKDELEQLK